MGEAEAVLPPKYELSLRHLLLAQGPVLVDFSLTGNVGPQYAKGFEIFTHAPGKVWRVYPQES